MATFEHFDHRTPAQQIVEDTQPVVCLPTNVVQWLMASAANYLYREHIPTEMRIDASEHDMQHAEHAFHWTRVALNNQGIVF